MLPSGAVMQYNSSSGSTSGTKLVHVTTIPMTLELFLRGQIAYMKKRGIDVIAVSSPGPALERVAERDAITVYPIPMKRGISPLADLISLVRLVRLFRRVSPDVVHSSTGKAGPLAMLAAKLAGVPIRFYSLRGIMMDRRSGFSKSLLKMLERISCLCSVRVLAVSQSVADVMLQGGYCPAKKLTVCASGSGNGVDALERFNPGLIPPGTRERLRKRHSISNDAFVIGFVGRLVAGKGIRELEAAWRSIRTQHGKSFLVTVGEQEAQDPVPEEVLRRLHEDDRVVMLDYVPNEEMPVLYSMMDLVVLPSYSEGLPNVPLEAAAMELPVVATRVTGCVDAIEDEITGILLPPQDWQALARAIARYAQDDELRRVHGKAARERVLSLFRPGMVWEAVYREYASALATKGA
jgi:glycosyltransferase involved in cell wall biosynthesis